MHIFLKISLMVLTIIFLSSCDNYSKYPEIIEDVEELEEDMRSNRKVGSASRGELPPCSRGSKNLDEHIDPRRDQ